MDGSVSSSRLAWLITLSILMGDATLIWHIHKRQQLQQREAAELASSKALAEKANAAKTSFLAIMSHGFVRP